MLKIKVNNKKEHIVEFENNNPSKGKIDGNIFEWDIIKIKKDVYHAIQNNRSYNIEVLKADISEKSLTVRINGNKYNLIVKDKYDELLQKLGIDVSAASKINNLKAPMPGLVLDIIVTEGLSVKKGDSIIILEAMKMENILKAPADAVIKKINVKKGIAVEKNQVLIDFQ